MAKASIKDTLLALKRILCIYYPFYFQKDITEVKVLFNSGSEINVITPVYTSKLGFQAYYIDVRA